MPWSDLIKDLRIALQTLRISAGQLESDWQLTEQTELDESVQRQFYLELTELKQQMREDQDFVKQSVGSSTGGFDLKEIKQSSEPTQTTVGADLEKGKPSIHLLDTHQTTVLPPLSSPRHRPTFSQSMNKFRLLDGKKKPPSTMTARNNM